MAFALSVYLAVLIDRWNASRLATSERRDARHGNPAVLAHMRYRSMLVLPFVAPAAALRGGMCALPTLATLRRRRPPLRDRGGGCGCRRAHAGLRLGSGRMRVALGGRAGRLAAAELLRFGRGRTACLVRKQSWHWRRE